MINAPLWGADFGSLAWHVYEHASGQFFTLSPEEFKLVNTWLPAGSRLIIEAAHMAPRTDFSLAQVYTEDELKAFGQAIKNNGSTLQLFPQQLTPKARAEFGITAKTDENDLIAMVRYVETHSELKLKKLSKTFVTERRREAAWQFKKENDGILNVARRFSYKKENDAVITFLNDNLEELAARLSPAARSIMMLDDSQRNSRTGLFKKTGEGARNARLYTLAALFLHPEGYARVRPDTGQMPGIGWQWRYVLGMSPFHFKGGIARSNLNWHAFRNYAIGALDTRKAGPGGKVLSHYHFNGEQQKQFRAVRKDFKLAVIETMQALRDMVKSQVDDGSIVLETV